MFLVLYLDKADLSMNLFCKLMGIIGVQIKLVPIQRVNQT